MKIKPLEIVTAIATMVFFLALIYLSLFAERFAPLREIVLPTPTVVYESLPTYSENEPAFYQPIINSTFTSLNTFKGVLAVNNKEYDNPFLLLDNTILIAGYIEEEAEGYSIKTTTELFSSDMSTGQVRWQTTVGSNQLATDGNYVFVEDIRQKTPGSIIAYDLHTGNEMWKTTLDFKYAALVDYLAIVPSGLIAVTYNKGFSAQYFLNPGSGVIEERFHILPVNKNPTYNNLVLSKNTEYRVGNVVATQVNDGSFLWRYEQPVVSNIAVGGPVTYFVNKNTELVAVDTMTGDVLGSLSFTPAFPEDFDFSNNHIIVAANGDTVAVYFRDKRQLSLFRFEDGQ